MADSCDLTCVAGCRCPDGQALNDRNECVTVDKCECIHNNKYYAVGQTIILSNSSSNELW